MIESIYNITFGKGRRTAALVKFDFRVIYLLSVHETTASLPLQLKTTHPHLHITVDFFSASFLFLWICCGGGVASGAVAPVGVESTGATGSGGAVAGSGLVPGAGADGVAGRESE